MDEIYITTFVGECNWTVVKIGNDEEGYREVALAPKEVQKLIKELEATIS